MNTSSEGPKLWGGRFDGKTHPLMEKFNNSLRLDQRLWDVDITASKAYARALQRAQIISAEESEALQAGLSEVAEEWRSGSFQIRSTDEDIHTANERRLSEIVGPVGGKLHTGRSRNDQVATDVRLWVMEEAKVLEGHMVGLISEAVGRAEKEMDYLMPGYTHLQPAQPIRWSHWLLSYAWAWQRDVERLRDVQRRVNMMPLGVGAIAGHPFGLDRDTLAQDLGFAGVMGNSLDAVSDRDFILEMLNWGSMTMVHLSRFAEDLIIYSSNEFRYVTISDAFSTGSSLMPQKKNPDALELLRGKAGGVIGNSVGLLIVCKGLPSTYNKDLQEDKKPLFETVETVSECLQIAEGVLATLTPNPQHMQAALTEPMLATDLSDYLVRKGIPFRHAHSVAGKAVKMSEDRDCNLSELTLLDLQSLDPNFEADAVESWDFERSVELRDTYGGTARSSCTQQISNLRQWLNTPHSQQ